MGQSVLRSLGVCAVLAASVAAAFGEEAPRPWTDQADLGLIVTSGNSENTSVSFSNHFVYKWTKSDFTLDATALRAKSTTRDLSYDNGEVDEDRNSKLTAKRYTLDGKYRYNFTDAFLGYGRAGWLRDEINGIQDRYVAGVGVGYRFLKSDVQNLVGELGVDAVSEKQVSGESDSYAGARAFLGYDRALSATSKLTSALELLDNLSDTPDWRGAWVTAVTASLTQKLALKVSYSVFYDNRPVVLELSDPLGLDPRIAEFEFDKTDTTLSAALVINF